MYDCYYRIILVQPVSLVDFKTPGADLKGVQYLRNVQDGDALIAAIADAKAAGGKVRYFTPVYNYQII